MRAIVRERFGSPDTLVIKEIPNPVAKPGHVLIEEHRRWLSISGAWYRSAWRA